MAERERKRSTVSSTEVQRHFRDVLRRVSNGEHVVVERDGIPAAVLMPVDEYEQFAEKREQEIAERLRRFDELGRSLREAADAQGLTEEKLLEQMRETRREMYEERFGRKS